MRAEDCREDVVRELKRLTPLTFEQVAKQPLDEPKIIAAAWLRARCKLCARCPDMSV